MYVILRDEDNAVFNGFGVTGRPQWGELDESKGIQLCMYVDPTETINYLECQGIKAIKMSMKGLFVMWGVSE
jgi:hypothetical protein